VQEQQGILRVWLLEEGDQHRDREDRDRGCTSGVREIALGVRRETISASLSITRLDVRFSRLRWSCAVHIISHTYINRFLLSHRQPKLSRS
jgi:hypothetical protein